MQIEFRPIESLSPYTRNSRTHSPEQIKQLVKLVKEFGWTNPVLADGSGIIAGHGRVMAAKKIYAEGITIRLPNGSEVPPGTVPVVDCTGWSEAQRKAYIIADNKSAENAGWDDGMLKLELSDLRALEYDLDCTGFSIPEIEGLLGIIPETEGKVDPDEVPDPPEEPITRPGDLWMLGHHRVLCADSTSHDAMHRLNGGGVR